MKIEIDTKQKQARLLEPCSLEELQDFLKAIDPESSLSWRITSTAAAPLVLPQAEQLTYCTNNELT